MRAWTFTCLGLSCTWMVRQDGCWKVGMGMRMNEYWSVESRRFHTERVGVAGLESIRNRETSECVTG